MDSLVERLRKPGACDLSLQAAAEIERLQYLYDGQVNEGCRLESKITTQMTRIAEQDNIIHDLDRELTAVKDEFVGLEAELEKVQKQVTYIKAEFDDAWKKEVITVDLGSAILAAMPKEEE